MFIPNNKVVVEFFVGTDAFGKKQYSLPKEISCGIVYLRHANQKTSVRTDSSATRGSAKEDFNSSRILFPSNVRLSFGDKVSINGFKMTVSKVHPRYSIPGRLDHWEVDLEANGD